MPTSTPRSRSLNYTGSAGGWRSASSTTAQALTCTSKHGLPRISVSALLQLARWCQQRQFSPQGGEPCPNVSATVCPPVSSGANATDSTEPVVGLVGSRTTATTLHGPERTGGASSPTRPEGGDA